MIFDFFDSPELLDIQRTGFFRFLKEDIPQLLAKEFPIKALHGNYSLSLCLNENSIKLIAPEDNPRDCILKMKSYNCKLYAQVKIVCRKSSSFTDDPFLEQDESIPFEEGNADINKAFQKERRNIVYESLPEWVLLGQLPMMTKRGHFIINGSPRVIVHQVVRSPGIYFQKLLKKDDQNRARFYGDIIPLKGVWVRLQMTKKGRVEAKFKKGKKVEVELLQKCLQVIENQTLLKRSPLKSGQCTGLPQQAPTSTGIHQYAPISTVMHHYAPVCNGVTKRGASSQNIRAPLVHYERSPSTSPVRATSPNFFQILPPITMNALWGKKKEACEKKQEIQSLRESSYQRLLEKKKNRAESKAEHDAFVHTYDKLYRTTQDKELEEWQKKKKNQKFFKDRGICGNGVFGIKAKHLALQKQDGKKRSCTEGATTRSYMQNSPRLGVTKACHASSTLSKNSVTLNGFGGPSSSPLANEDSLFRNQKHFLSSDLSNSLSMNTTFREALSQNNVKSETLDLLWQKKLLYCFYAHSRYKGFINFLAKPYKYKAKLCIRSQGRFPLVGGHEQKSEQKSFCSAKLESFLSKKEKMYISLFCKKDFSSRPKRTSATTKPENAFKRKKCSEALFATFKSSSRYSLGRLGREKINNRFSLLSFSNLQAESFEKCKVSAFASQKRALTTTSHTTLRFVRDRRPPSKVEQSAECPNLQINDRYEDTNAKLLTCSTHEEVEHAKRAVSQRKKFSTIVDHRKVFRGSVYRDDKGDTTQLTSLDLCYATIWLYRLRKGEESTDDIDHSQNRRVRTSGELLQTQFENGVSRLKNLLSTKLQEWRGDRSASQFSSLFNKSYKQRYNPKIALKSSRNPLFRFARNILGVAFISTTPPTLPGSRSRSFAFESPLTCAYKSLKTHTCTHQSCFRSDLEGSLEPCGNASTCTEKHRNAPKCTEMHRNAPKCTEGAKQSKAKQSKAKQSKAKQSKVKQSKAKELHLYLHLQLYRRCTCTCTCTTSSPTKQVEGVGHARSFALVSPRQAPPMHVGAKRSLAKEFVRAPVVYKQRNKRKLSNKSTYKYKYVPFTNKAKLCSCGLSSYKSSYKYKYVPEGLSKICKKICKKICTCKPTIKELFSTKPITGALREFFGSNPLSQYMDQTNPLAEITHKRRLSSLGLGGVSRESAGMAIRGIHPTHYGRICPIETPEGKNAGLVNSLAFYTKVDETGFLKTPYYRVFKGQIQASLGFSFCSAKDESTTGLQIAPSDLQKSSSNVLRTTLSIPSSIPVRVADNFLDVFKKENPYNVQLIAISPIQMISVATSLIPFLEHNDANRALMGSNMQRQAVPLMISERPIVGTGLESTVIVESGHITESQISGFASHVTANRVIIDRLLQNTSLGLYSHPIWSPSGQCTFIHQKAPKSTVMHPLPQKESLKAKLFRGKGRVTKQNLDRKLVSPYKSSYKSSICKKTYTCKGKCTEMHRNAPKCTEMHRNAPKCTEMHRNTPKVQSKAKQSKAKQSKAKQSKAKQSKSLALAPKVHVHVHDFVPYKEGKKLCFNKKKASEHFWNGTRALTNHTNLGFVRDRCVHLKRKDARHFSKGKEDSVLHSTVSLLTTFSRSNQNTSITEKPLLREFDWVQRGDILTDCSASNNGELAVGKNVLLAYIPWEGYNFEDAIVISDRLVREHVYTSLHIERYVFQAQDLKEGAEWFTKHLPGVKPFSIQHLEESGLPKIGSFLKEGDIIVGKIRYLAKKPSSPYERLLCDILGEKNFAARNKSLYVPKGVSARVIYHKVISAFDNTLENKVRPPEAAKTVHIFLGEKRVIQVGDKISGRHGNKGVISTILPRQDMPYLPDGTPIDLILNPLGVPSRMNVGQVLECLLGLAASYLNSHFKIASFDEKYGVEASKSIVFLKLYQARLMSGQNWLFQVSFPGKTRLIDGRSGECFDQWITVGKAYILKLIHMVSEKIHARSTGPYALITQQPLRGRSNKGGQRLGEMEVWALEGFGAAYTLQELLTKKSDDFFGRKQIVDSILPNPTSIIDRLEPSYRIAKSRDILGHPEIFKVLLCELQALCLDLGVYIVTPESFKRTFLGVVH